MPARSKHVVVIDDNEVLLRAWKRILEHEGCRPYVTSQPAEALDYIARHGADLVVCDVVLPTRDGFDLLGQIRRLDPDLPVMLTTGYVCDFTRLPIEAVPHDLHVLLKPYGDIDRVEGLIHHFLEPEEDEDATLEDEVFTIPGNTKVHLWHL